MLLFIKTNVWKTLFGKEADKLEHANDDERIYYIIEKEPLVNKFISVPKDKGSLNCAVFIAGIVQAILFFSGFVSTDQQTEVFWLSDVVFSYIFQPCEVSAHWHKGTTYMVKFEESVIARDRQLEEK